MLVIAFALRQHCASQVGRFTNNKTRNTLTYNAQFNFCFLTILTVFCYCLSVFAYFCKPFPPFTPAIVQRRFAANLRCRKRAEIAHTSADQEPDCQRSKGAPFPEPPAACAAFTPACAAVFTATLRSLQRLPFLRRGEDCTHSAKSVNPVLAFLFFFSETLCGAR